MLFQILAIFVLNFFLFSKATDLYWTEESTDLQDVGDTACQSKEYPFMVFFTNKKSIPSRCSGSLISTEWVLTSKDCVEKQIDINNCLVIAGTSYQSNHLWDSETVKFLCLQAATEGDLGLVKIETVDPFPDHIYLIYHYRSTPNPILDDNEHAMEDNATSEGESVQEKYLGVVLGFLATPDSKSELRNATHDKKHSAALSLWRLRLPLLSEEECQQRISDVFQPQDSVVCTVCDFGSKTTCFMDQGGPLIHMGRLLGVVTGPYSRHCFLKQSLAVYAKVSQYESWIEKTLRIESAPDSFMRSNDPAVQYRHVQFNGGPSSSSVSSSLLQTLVVVVLMKNILFQKDGLV